MLEQALDGGRLLRADGTPVGQAVLRDAKAFNQDRDKGVVEAEALRGAQGFVPRSSFPTAGDDEYYWVDLIGLDVVNREGVALGRVKDLMATGPQTVLVLQYEEE